jgi:2-methylcitrate dehydratase PrpD
MKLYKFGLNENRIKVTEKLSQFVVNLNYKDIPKDVTNIAKYLILDTIGVTLAGSQELSSKIIMNIIKKFEGEKESTIFGCKNKTSAIYAALINGTMARALEFEETHNIGGHPLVSILPAALSIGEKNGISGAELITSIVIGYDIHCRIGCGAKISHILAG